MSIEGRNEDKDLLAVIRELFVQLGIENVQVDTVRWVQGPPDWSDSYAIAPDCPFFRDSSVCMPADMIGVLQPEEWKPMLASSMILHFQVKIQRRQRRALLAFFVGWPLSLLAVWLLNFLVVLPGWPVAIGVILSFFLGLYAALRMDSWARLAADRKVARLLGKQNFLQALQKAADNNPDHDRVFGRDPPSIRKRVKNIVHS